MTLSLIILRTKLAGTKTLELTKLSRQETKTLELTNCFRSQVGTNPRF